MEEIIGVIRKIEFFQGLSDSQLRQLAAICGREVYSGGDLIIQQDMPGDCLYIIVEGQVEIIKRDLQGELHTALFLGAGQVFGEIVMLDQGLRTATVIADDDPTVVFTLKREPFDTLCRADTALGYQMMRNLALDLAFKLRHQS